MCSFNPRFSVWYVSPRCLPLQFDTGHTNSSNGGNVICVQITSKKVFLFLCGYNWCLCHTEKWVKPLSIINPRRACAARVTVLGLFLPSVCPVPLILRNKAAKKRVQCHTGLIFKIAIVVNVLRSKVMA